MLNSAHLLSIVQYVVLHLIEYVWEPLLLFFSSTTDTYTPLPQVSLLS